LHDSDEEIDEAAYDASLELELSSQVENYFCDIPSWFLLQMMQLFLLWLINFVYFLLIILTFAMV